MPGHLLGGTSVGPKTIIVAGQLRAALGVLLLFEEVVRLHRPYAVLGGAEMNGIPAKGETWATELTEEVPKGVHDLRLRVHVILRLKLERLRWLRRRILVLQLIFHRDQPGAADRSRRVSPVWARALGFFGLYLICFFYRACITFETP